MGVCVVDKGEMMIFMSRGRCDGRDQCIDATPPRTLAAGQAETVSKALCRVSGFFRLVSDDVGA